MFLPKSLEVIGEFCFAGCENLREICVKKTEQESKTLESLPKNLKSIGKSAFSNCSNLQKMIFHENFKGIIYVDPKNPESDLKPEFEAMFKSKDLDIFFNCSKIAPQKELKNDRAVLTYLLKRYEFDDNVGGKTLMTLCTTGGTVEEIRKVRRDEDSEK